MSSIGIEGCFLLITKAFSDGTIAKRASSDPPRATEIHTCFQKLVPVLAVLYLLGTIHGDLEDLQQQVLSQRKLAIVPFVLLPL